MDADGEHDPGTLALFRTKLLDEDYPLVLGYRPRKQRLAEIEAWRETSLGADYPQP